MAGPKLTLTGAGGALGLVLRPRLIARGAVLTAAGHRLPKPVSPEERVLGGDLREDAVVDAALAGADAVIHLAGSSVEKPLAEIIQNNLVALQRLYEGARRHQVKRIVFASSNHTIGMYPAGQRLTLADKVRPDGNYGLSKVWGEAMGQLYFDKFGIETVSLRIGSAIERPTEPRHLSTWLGYDDLEDLVWRAATVPDVGCLTVWGVSANTRSWWDNAEAAALGYAPKQNAEDYAEEILRGHDPGWRFQGGSFALADVT
ncbi:NAD-dependent epimerase/dehydratase family protein [Acidocella facilis]|uniref:NAD-dependent epimerase/dehydratase family protein n=1 Tax=Acidocella facilis TaxID=525 RepID=UPI00047D498B|nr:NAD(P)-dependent oxidoreductase [Acidocella facilis]